MPNYLQNPIWKSFLASIIALERKHKLSPSALNLSKLYWWASRSITDYFCESLAVGRVLKMKEFFQTQANVIIAGHSGHAWMLASVLPLAQYRADFCSKDLHTPTHFCVSVNKDSLCCHIFFCYFWPTRSLRKKCSWVSITVILICDKYSACAAQWLHLNSLCTTCLSVVLKLECAL